MEGDEGSKTLFVSNLSHRVTDELIHELFLQAGPIENCSIADKSNHVAIIQFKHEASVPYATDVFKETVLHGRKLFISATNPYPQTDYAPEVEYFEPRYDPHQRNRNYSHQNNSGHARNNDYYGHDKFRRNRPEDSRRRHQPYHREEHSRMRRYDNYHPGNHRY